MLIVFMVILATLAFAGGRARAEEAVIIEVAQTGLYLPNHALSQDKHYLTQDADLLGRIACLMQDVDSLLAELHALPPGLGESPAAMPATAGELARLIALALKNNPELAPYRSKLAMQAAQTRQAGAKPDPLLMFNFAAFPLPDFSAGDVPMTQYVLGWSQQYVSYGKRGLKRSIASLNEDLTVLELNQRELEIIGEITGLYFAMASTQARLRVVEDNTDLLQLLVELAERKYALGRTPQAQVLQAQAQLSKLEERRITLKSMLDTQTEILGGLLGHSADFNPAALTMAIDYPLPTAVDFDADQLLAAALDQRPDYQRLDLMEDQQELKVELAHRAYRPDYTVSASYGLRYGKRDFLSAGISIPLFTHKAERQDAALQEAYAGLDITESNRAQLENMLATRLRTLRVELDRAVEIGGLYREGLVPQARLALDSSIAGYAANQVDLADLLSAQQMLLSYELELEQIYIDYLAALSDLSVLTAGVFDPLPYLVPDLGAGRTAAAIPPSAEELISAEELAHQQQQLRELEGPPEEDVPSIGGMFISELGLPVPETAPQAEDTPVEQSDGAALEAIEREPVPDVAQETSEFIDEGAFYAPLKLKDQEQDDD